jgi:hypothetical protein
MAYLGDYAEDYATLNLKFTTRQTTGAPFTLGGTPVVSVYKANGLVQTTAGITLTVDFDAVTGLNNVLIDLSADAFYAVGNDYQVVITTGTVNGVSVVGEVVGEFSVQNRSSSLNATALAALEDQFDGTGLTGDSYPSTQVQVGNLATGSAAISTVAESDLVTTGTEVNTYAVTDEIDGVYHEVTDVAGAMDLYYQFDVGGNGVASTCQMTGRLTSANDTIGVYAYNWGGTSWDQIGSLVGTGGTADGVELFSLLTRHTGIAANLGKVRIRGFAASGLTSSTLYIDQAIVSYAVVAQSVGYANGAVWVDTVSGTAGTESYVNGVADNPSLTLADASTIASNLSLHKYELSTDSSITFVSAHANHVFIGKGYSIALGGQAATGSHIIGASVSGTATTGGDEIHFSDCELGACTLGASHFHNCGLTGTITLSQAATYTLQTCHSEVAGSGSPILDFGAAVGNTALNMRRYSGGIEIQNMGQLGTDTMSIEGNGALTINANCTGGTIAIRGDFKVTDNSGAVTLVYDDSSQNLVDVKTKTDQMVFTKANELDANTKSINSATVIGDGNATPWDGA